MDSTLDDFWQDFPVWATINGIHEYDDKLTDFSEDALNKRRMQISDEVKFMENIDTTGWDIDDRIDFEMDYHDLIYELSDTRKYRLKKISPAYYIEDCGNGVFMLYIRDPDLSDHTCRSIIERVRQIPEFLMVAKENINNPEYVFTRYSRYLSEFLCEVIGHVCIEIIDKYPERNAEIATLRDKAILALKEFQDYYAGQVMDQDKEFSIGEDEFISFLKTHYFLDMDLSVIEQIAESLFVEADSMIGLYKKEENPESESFGLHSSIHYSPEWDSILAYANYELESFSETLDSIGLFHIPKNKVSIRYEKKPQFFDVAGIYDDVFEPAGVFDSNQTSIFYIETGLRWNHDYSSRFTVEPNKKYRFNVAKHIIPGTHFVNQSAISSESYSRMIQNNPMFILGWELYTKELLFNEGIFESEPEDMVEFYSEVRKAALCAIVEIKIHTGVLNFEEARKFVDVRLGEDSTTFANGLILFTMINPAIHGLSPTLGRYYFNKILIKARYMEGSEFDYREFHRKIISEGKIPPALIARKYGWD
jgi:uncharacterized protein (DUF885 family)